MLDRKEELNRQMQQILDGLLMVIAFWGAHTLRFMGNNWFFPEKQIGPMNRSVCAPQNAITISRPSRICCI